VHVVKPDRDLVGHVVEVCPVERVEEFVHEAEAAGLTRSAALAPSLASSRLIIPLCSATPLAPVSRYRAATLSRARAHTDRTGRRR
jgi:hypothetical protein